eukprot:1264449-Pyramimonas_sp.AAC.1
MQPPPSALFLPCFLSTRWISWTLLTLLPWWTHWNARKPFWLRVRAVGPHPPCPPPSVALDCGRSPGSRLLCPLLLSTKAAAVSCHNGHGHGSSMG